MTRPSNPARKPKARPVMAKPVRIQRSRAKGWRMPPNTVSVTRPGPWGNPFAVGPGMTAVDAVDLFEKMCGGYLCLLRKPTIAQQEEYLAHAKANLESLRGKNLACWCSLKKLCHADLLLRVANKPKRKKASASKSG